MPWVKTAAHLLEGKDSDEHLMDGVVDTLKKHRLPSPKLPPNATHTQLYVLPPPTECYVDTRLHPSFTHRESPAFVAVFLNLYNSSELEHPASEEPPLDRRLDGWAWKTSHLISFVGHVALERFKDDRTKESYVRAVVNGQQEEMGGCSDGIWGSCKMETFQQWVEDRVNMYADWESVCEPKNKE